MTRARAEASAPPILLFNDECSVCRRIGRWVQREAGNAGAPTLIVRPIGEDPQALRLLNPGLTIWDAYETIHLLMPDGSMKLGGEGVAEVLRNLPVTSCLARSFAISIFGIRPFQRLLDLACAVLADVRPLFGCESCGTPRPWVRPIALVVQWASALFGGKRHTQRRPHSTARAHAGPRHPVKSPRPAVP